MSVEARRVCELLGNHNPVKARSDFPNVRSKGYGLADHFSFRFLIGDLRLSMSCDDLDVLL